MPENNEEENREEIKEDKDVSTKETKKKKSKKIKKSTIKKISTIAVLVVVLAVVLYFAFKTLRPEQVIARVNDEIITKEELEQKYGQLPEQYKLFITKDNFLDQIVNVKLLLQEAKKQEIVVSEEEIETEIDKLKRQAPTEEAFEQLLEQRNIQLYELEKQVKEQLTINKLLNESVFSKIKISDSKIKEYYDANKGDFEAKEGEIRIRHILVAQEEEAKQLLKELQAGKDFSELAKLSSIDAVSAAQGGDLGFTKKGQMVKEFEDAAFSLKVGQLSSIVKTQFGHHIIKREPNNIPYKEAKDQIRQILLNEISNNAIEIYMNQLKLNATIIKKGVKITTKIETFTKTEDTICKENDKVIVRLFSTSKNSASRWISKTFDETMNEYKDSVIAYHWELDTGDNLLTDVKEEGILKDEVDIFKRYNSNSTVPTYIFGCKYVRIGNAYKTLDEEEAEFKRVIELLI